MEILVYRNASEASGQNLEQVLRAVEEKGVALPGIVQWCEQCRKVSVISYTRYRAICREDGMAEESIQCVTSYYTRCLYLLFVQGSFGHAAVLPKGIL